MSAMRNTSVTSTAATHLRPDAAFPADLSDLALVELQVLHSQLARQLDCEYLDGPGGPHPVTQERIEQVLVELRIREARMSTVTDLDREPVIDVCGKVGPTGDLTTHLQDDLQLDG